MDLMTPAGLYRRLAIHPLIDTRLTIDHDSYGAVVHPSKEYLDLTPFWPVDATIDAKPPDSDDEAILSAYRQKIGGRTGLEKYHGQPIIGLVDRSAGQASRSTHWLMALTANGYVFYVEPTDLIDLTVLDQAGV